MSHNSTGISALTLEETGLSCSNYYDDQTFLTFTNEGELAILKNGEQLLSTPLTGINFPVDDWGVSTVTLNPPDSKGKTQDRILDFKDTGTVWEVSQISSFSFNEIYANFYPFKKCKLQLVTDDEIVYKETGVFDISNVNTIEEFVDALKKAMDKVDLDLDLDLYTDGDKVVLRVCEKGISYNINLIFYEADGKTETGRLIADIDRRSTTYDYPYPSFIALLVTFEDSSSSSSQTKKCGCGNLKIDVESDSELQAQDVIRWASLDLYTLFKDTDKENYIWDNLSKILIHSGLKNQIDGDDCQVKPLVLRNVSPKKAIVKIIAAN